MKKRIIFNGCIFLLMFLLFSCDPEDLSQNQNGTDSEQSGNPNDSDIDVSETIVYPQSDSEAVDLDTIAVTEERLFRILNAIDPETDAMKLYKTSITETQMTSIGTDVQKEILTSTDVTPEQKYQSLFNWVNKNIKYNYSGQGGSNDPYDVYLNRTAVCQGYANLLKVMCLTQNIPAVSANGLANMGSFQGHAWLYVYVGNQWKLSDPTNGKTVDLNMDSSTDQFRPTSVELDLFEDDNFVYEYADSHLNVSKVKKADRILTIPYSAGGFVVNAFSPNFSLPSSVEEIVLGRNISALTNGETTGGTPGLETFGTQITKIHIDPENPVLESYEGAIYKKSSSVPYFIPHQLSVLVLKPGQMIYGKDASVIDRNNITEIIFPDDTTQIGDWTVERCNSLKTVSVPKGAQIGESAFPEGVEVVFRETAGTEN